MSFFREKPEKFKKERSLYDDTPKPRTFDNLNIEDSEEKKVQEIFSKIEDEIKLGNELLRLFDEKCRATHIPVPAELQNIRSAVRRKDNAEPDGAKISFALFLTSIKKYEQIKIQYSLLIQDQINENPELDAQRVTNLKVKVMNGIGESDLFVFSSIWLLNYIVTKYQDIFNVPTMMQIAASPQSAAVGAIKLTLALAFAAFIEAVFDDEGRRVTTGTDNRINPDQLSRVEQLAVKKIGENDYDLILDYAIKYIYSTNDQKYDPWISYLAVRQSRNSSVDLHKYYPSYSTEEFLKINYVNEDDSGETVAADYVEDRILENFKQNFINETRPLAADFESIYTSISAKNRMVFNTAAQASAYKLTKDQVCCFIRILSNSGVDRRTLRTLKCVIRMASQTLSAQLFMGFGNKALNGIKQLDVGPVLVNRIKGILSSMLRRLHGDFIQRVNDREVTEIEAKCATFSSTFDMFFDAIDDIVSNIQREFYLENGKIDQALKNSELTLQTKYQIRILNDIELMIAAILDQALEECVRLEDDVAEEILDEVIGSFNIPSNQYTIDISDEMREKYFSDSKPIRLLKKSSEFGRRSKVTIPAIDKFNSPETSEEVIRNILRTCKIDLTDEQIKQMLKDTDGSSR